MRPWPPVVAISCIAAALAPSEPAGETYAFLIAGDLHGKLSPCGCTKPMSGGIRRMGSAIRSLAAKEGTVFLVNDGISGGSSRQDELKLDTVAESLRALDVAAINLGGSEARLGRGPIQSAIQLSEDRFIATGLQESPSNPVPPYALKGPFLIGGLTNGSDALARTMGEKPRSAEASASWLVQQAKESQFIPVLMIQMGRNDAVELAKDLPSLKLIVYSATGIPRMEKIGGTTIVTPGEKGKYLVRLLYKDGVISGYVPVNLGPEFKDDPQVSRLYKNYLSRVAQEKLLEKLPRRKTAAFAGNAKCGSCHKEAMKIWQASKHAIALRTLEREGQQIDPDCVSCHVVRLDSTVGFRSRKFTPQLANVGCESCHGPGKGHAFNPRIAMPKIGPSACLTCHTGNTSPGFAFASYWKKIIHK